LATQQLASVQTVKLPLAMFSYLILVWVPISVSALLMVAWQAATGQHLPIAGCVAFLVILRQVNVFTLSTLFHRSYSHRQFTYHPWVEHPMRVWNWFWCGTGGRAWSILHRWHHAAVDTDNDPHSPTKTGGTLWNITKQTFASYQECLHNPAEFSKYEYKLPDDKFEHFVRWLEGKKLWGLVVFRLPLIIAVMTLFMPLPAAILCLPGIIGSVWFSTVVVVNGLCHVMGYRVMDSGDTSTNLFPVDFLGWGEALHHNHHFKQGRANLAIRSFEFDPGFWTLYALSKVGIVRDLRP
jgi:stearoyl-CoA desaturase (Delta-9 desaturase)